MTAKIIGWANIIFKVGIVLSLSDSILAMMQRQITEIVALLAVCSENDAFGRCSIALYNTETLAEVFLRIEILAHLKLHFSE